MANFLNQVFNLLRSLPLSKKITMALVFVFVVAGFAFMFLWTNQTEYQVLFSNLSPEDGGAIVSELRGKNVPYQVEANGTAILVPAEVVHDLRLDLAGEGLPRGGHVGFEIFDHTDFRTTKFVQELNYRRALQGELARTINRFKNVRSSRVFIVLPKESLFIEESRPASASIQLDLFSNLPASKLAAIVHLVASAVEGLEPEHVTVVDTKGSVIFKGGIRDNASALLSDAQLGYKTNIENEIRKNVQSMLEGIVGVAKAIVRVNAEIDFNKITLSEEEYDPDSTVVRSRRDILESTESSERSAETAETVINQRRGVVPDQTGAQNRRTKKDVATNYEINKITKTVLKPAGTIRHLSVAAVIDGTYEVETGADGTTKRIFVPRSEDELRKFEDIVKKAMGYNEDREDQVSVTSIPFSQSISMDPTIKVEGTGFDLPGLVGSYKKTIVNLLLVAMIFFFIVRPLLKSMKHVTREPGFEHKELPPASTEEPPQIPESREMSRREKALEISKNEPEKTEHLLKGWIAEQE